MMVSGCQSTAVESSGTRPVDNTSPLVAAEPPDLRPCKLDVVADLAIQRQQGIILVDATINDQPARMVLDTGSQDTIITPNTAKRFRLQETNFPAGEMAGIGGVRKSAFYQADNVRIGSLHGRTWNFVIADVGAGYFHPAPDGLLALAGRR